MMYKTVSLDPTTYATLTEYRARLELAVLRQPACFPEWLRQRRPSLTDAIAFLLHQQERHQQRANKAKRKGRAGVEEA